MIARSFRRRPATPNLRTRLWLAALEDRSVPATFTVSNILDGAVAAPGDLPGSLRQAIFDANLLAGADLIDFDATFASPQTILLSAGELAVTADLTITGPGKALATIDGNLANRHFKIDGTGTITVSISDLTLTKGRSTGGTDSDRGGAIFVNDEKVSITDTDFIDNQSSAAPGGAIALLVGPGELTVTGSKFINNGTGVGIGGGAINVAGGKFTMSNSTLSGNTAGGRGGAVYLTGTSTSSIINTNFDATSGTSNGSGTQGGAIAVNGGTITITGGTFDQNGAVSRAGAGYFFGSTSATVSGATVTANTAGSTAGGFSVGSGSKLQVSTTSFTNNKSGGRGGALYFTGSGSAMTVSNSTFTTNNNGVNGGGAIAGLTGTFICQDSTFTGNSATGRGGALYFTGGANATILRTTVTGSVTTGGANAGGGGIGHQNGFLTVQDCTVTGNSTPSRGGGIYANAVTAFIDRTLVSNNTAGTFGGGVSLVQVNANSLPVVRNCTLTGNTAARFGGGIDVYLGYGIQTILGCTIVGNTVTSVTAGEGGGGLARHSSGTGLLTVESCIIANNTNSIAPDASGTFTANNNLVESTIGVTLSGTGNVTGLDPMLGALTNNGGLTLSFMPGGTSPALNAGKNSSPGAAFDQRGSGFTRSFGKTDIGSIERTDVGIPTASTPLVNITATSDAHYVLTVTYADDTAIDTAKLDSNDIRVTGPNSFNQLASFVGFTGGPGVVVAQYSFAPPGGIWDGTDRGTYTVSLELSQVGDTATNDVPTGAMGNFLVDIGRNIVVTSTANSGVGTLRQALLDANFSQTPDTITFDPTVFPVSGATITLATVLPIDSPVTISGLGPTRVKINGNDSTRIFLFNNLPGQPTSAISGVTLEKGRTTGTLTTDRGGAIFINNSSDIVNISNVAFANNKATGARGGAIGINSGSIVTITGSTFTGNQGLNPGGAITLYGGGNLTVTDTSFTTNASTASGSQGGAIFLYSGTFTADRVTLSSNTSGAGAGGGGAIAINQAASSVNVVTIRNTTISTNASGVGTLGGGGLLVNRTSTGTLNLKVQNTTIAFNSASTGGGVSFVGVGAGAQTIAFDGTLIAKNTGTAPDVNGAINANNCLIGNNVGAAISGTGNVIGDVAGSGPAVDPLLGVLNSNGGATKTHALSLGSPAIDVGSNVGALATDQRGVNRTIGALTDIGSYEFNSSTPTTFVVINLADNGAGSLRQAILDSNNNTFAHDTITFDSGLNGTITLTTGELAVTDSLTITGLTGNKITVSGNNASRVFNISDATAFATTVTITDLNLTSGNSTADGGAVFVENEILTLDRVVISNSTTTTQGGGIGVGPGGALTLRYSTVSGNSASTIGGVDVGGYGGGVYFANAGNLSIENSTVSGNSAAQQGGGIYFFGKANSGSILVRNSTISGNSSGSDGGGIIVRNFTGDLTVHNSTIAFNTATSGMGGGISIIGTTGTITLESSIVAKNVNATAPDIGGKATATFSLVGNVTGASLIGVSNKVGVDPLLGALANNGGTTNTHALLSGSPALNTGSNSAGLLVDQRGTGFARVVGAAADMGAFELQQTPAKINPGGVVINSKLVTPADKSQRSRVTDVAITFDSKVSFVGGDINAAAAFTLNRISPAGSVTLAASVDNTGPGTVVTLTFISGTVDNISLADGRYALHIVAAQFASGLDGDGNGIGGDDFIFDEPAAPAPLDATKIFRIFGDITGDGSVASNDFIQFRLYFNGVNYAFDFDNDSAVASSDFIQFRQRFNGSI